MLHVADQGTCAVITCVPEHLGSLSATVEAALARGCQGIVLDLDHITYLTSLQIATIITVRQSLFHRGYPLAVAQLTPSLRAIFTVLKLERVLNLNLDRAQAVKLVST